MKTYFNKITVAYSDTDQMGIVHHSNYLRYYETARWSLFKILGIPYAMIEECGYLLPVISADVKYIKPAFYDEELTIETSLLSFNGPKIYFGYRLFNKSGELINKAHVYLAFVDIKTRKACLPPDFVRNKLNLLFSKALDNAC